VVGYLVTFTGTYVAQLVDEAVIMGRASQLIYDLAWRITGTGPVHP
jgi:hypothetical protein